MPNIYLIRQDHSHLYGNTLESAVVIADSIPSARRSLKTALLDQLQTVIWDEALWAITRLGNNAKYPPDPFGPVVCTNIYHKNQFPPGNYGATNVRSISK